MKFCMIDIKIFMKKRCDFWKKAIGKYVKQMKRAQYAV